MSSEFILTDENVMNAWGESIRGLGVDPARTFVVPSGETSKSLSTACDLWRRLREQGADRYSLLVAIGGGVVGDLGGFVASTYMRGFPFAMVPTSLLAQVDSSVGGKVGINFEGSKNVLGQFSAPTSVVIDRSTLSTLSDRDLRAGWAELLKHGLIADRELWQGCDKSVIPEESVLERAVSIKAKIVIEDERELGPRRLLNLGHTLGHAIESESGSLTPLASLRDRASTQGVVTPEAAVPSEDLESGLRHGEAVSLGIVAAARLSVNERGLEPSAVEEIEAKLSDFGLPIRIPSAMSGSSLIARLGDDKKRRGGRLPWTLLDAIGQGCHGVEISEREVTRVLSELGARG